LYTHAGTWAIQMEAFLGRNEKAWELFKKISPVDRGFEPDLYQSEPYVTPGNVDGPNSPHYGRGGWTWYTGSAAWLYRVMMEWILGVRPDWDGLKIDPRVPSQWEQFTVKRVYRNRICVLVFRRDTSLKKNNVQIEFDGKRLPSNIIAPEFLNNGSNHFIIHFN
ncbi:MAG: glycosyl transferase family 36, partial [Elusimicrobia bacterium]|nr:glycosyl transferase family 36 [Elusimicrobiota bacterium]